ncbi:Uncharacterized protein BP5553_06502 [Venustampulla echinocandica]|uniref:Cellobiose dehydrogenase-like cytochrome domain-containing protein n=1 Tax=Venustampulla echinocandica TaxID=2656787 RepID=A0A370TK38_9HELO|nr:Uncharacterized protein BP5553_06502 [Venustampulla echinocandica]RDL35890.1 Uncharacterized protein BP5553_06502 [Venustampulla echinocandica]
MVSFVLSALAFTFAILLATAQSTTPAFSNLYDDEVQMSFSINLPINSTDVYFSFSAPAYSWVAIGAGNYMAGSLMMIIYGSPDAQGITISPRIATGHTEPTFTTDVQVEVLDGTSIQNNLYVLNALCHGCRSWKGGSLNLNTTVQPFMYAFGPNIIASSDSPTLGLRRHYSFGHFTMDMIQATGPGSVPPAASTIKRGAALAGSLKKDGDKASPTHGILMIIVALILIPFDVIIVGVCKWMRPHILISSFSFLVVITSMGLGIYVSTEYNRSKTFNTPHQIIGFISILGLLFIAGLGIYSRQLQNKASKIDVDTFAPPAKSSSLLFSTIHSWTARLIWLLLIVNNGIGMKFASTSRKFVVIYAILAVLVFFAMWPVYYCIFRRERKKRVQQDENSGGFAMT